MRAGDRYRLIGIGFFATLCYCIVLGALSSAANVMPLRWVLPLGLLLGVATAFASGTMFGVLLIERLAANRVHGGRHYYYEYNEIKVRIGSGETAWVRLADVAAIVGGEPGVARFYSVVEAKAFDDEPEVVYVSFSGVRRYLALRRSAGALKFSQWFERQLVTPMQQRTQRGLPLLGTGDEH